MYNRADRTYFGVVGRWKWINAYGSGNKINLPIPGVLIGKEWFSKRINLKSFAIELGYQYGVKEYQVINFAIYEKQDYNEFPLIINLRYSFYKKR